MPFPLDRPRRLRRTAGLRRLTRETRLSVDQLVYPLFIAPGRDLQQEIPSMPGQFRWSVDTAVCEAQFAADPSEENLAALNTIRDELSSHIGFEAQIEGFGEASGRPATVIS